MLYWLHPGLCPVGPTVGEGSNIYYLLLLHVGEGVWMSMVAWKGWWANEGTGRHMALGQGYPGPEVEG